MKSNRPNQIRQLLFANGEMSIAQLAVALGASEPTIRRDLTEMEKGGVVVRSHGGARIADDANREIAFDAREQVRLPQKRAISEAAYELLTPNTSIFLDAGTTVLQLARLIRLRPVRLDIFTNCLPVAQVLLDVPEVDLTVLGGQVRAENASMVGAVTQQVLEGLRFNQAFLGMGALGDDGFIYTADSLEAMLNASTLKRCDRAVILSDSSKLGTYLTHRVGALEPGTTLVTDDELRADWQERLREMGIALEIAGPTE